jgi:DNA-dependent protein kinase catalytic subunit
VQQQKLVTKHPSMIIEASNENESQEFQRPQPAAEKQQLKKDFSLIYEKILPVLFAIASDFSHPGYKLLNTLTFQLIRWLAHSKQVDSPEISVLLDALMVCVSSHFNMKMRELGAKCIGEFVKWTIKVTTDIELKVNQGNIKMVLRRIQSYSGHPDEQKRLGSLLALREFLAQIKLQKFLVEKFILELTCRVFSFI